MSDVFKFLLGEGSIDGAWFGDLHPQAKGQFWWRKHLRAEIERLTRGRDRYHAALVELSCLGNGELPGNSTGNTIAIRALKEQPK